MKKLLLALALFLLPVPAFAQCNGVFPNNTVCGNVTGASNTPRATNPSAFLGAAGGTNGQTQYNNAGALGGYTPSGDITVVPSTGVETIQPGAVSNGKLVAGAANTVKSSLNGTTVVDTLFTTMLNSACTLLPTTCSAVFGYTYTGWYGAVCDGTTDDRAALQAAINGTTQGHTLWLQPSASGCLINSTGTSGAVTYGLIINKPMNLQGSGTASWLKTGASLGNTVVNLYVFNSNFFDWTGSIFSGFQISVQGAPVNLPYTRTGGRGIWFDATTFGGLFISTFVDNVSLGESSNDYSIVFDGAATTLNQVRNSRIFGGIHFDKVADSNFILNNEISGATALGVILDCSAGGGAESGQCAFIGNNMTASGGLIIDAGSNVQINQNYFEELHTPHFARGAMIDLRGSNGAIDGTHIFNNVIANIVSTTTLGIVIGTSGGFAPTHTYIGANFIANLNARTAVNNFGTTTNCAGINEWQTSATHVTGTGSLTNAVGGSVGDCP